MPRKIAARIAVQALPLVAASQIGSSITLKKIQSALTGKPLAQAHHLL